MMGSNKHSVATQDQGSAERIPKLVNIHHADGALKSAYVQDIDISLCKDSIRLKFKNQELVVIRMSQVLSRMSQDKAIELLKECRRVLNTHGVLHVIEGGDLPNGMTHSQIEDWLRRAGFEEVSDFSLDKDLAAFCGVKDKSIVGGIALAARDKMVPHAHDSLLSRTEFLKKCEDFRANNSTLPDVTFIVTIYNEAQNLPHFLSFLERIEDQTGMKREFIFVVNGCTDSSETMLRKFVGETQLNARLIESEKGILPAFKAGIASRHFNGFIGRFDADIILHPQVLDLMQMHLVENQEVQVTYAEPLPLDSPSVYNAAAYNPELMSKRLYYTGKTSLYRENPHDWPDVMKMPPQLVADDIFLSFYYVYYFGFEAISRAPHGVVYEKVVGNFEDLVRQISRCDSEIQRIYEAYPHIRVLDALMVQKIYPSEYKDLMDKAASRATYVDDWTRLDSTK